MLIIDAVQGTPEWHAARLEHFTASEAPAMMGKSKYQSREELLKLKKTGIAPEVDPATQRLFDKGHAAEAAIRPHVENILLEELYPVVGIKEGTKLLASFDGLTMLEDIVLEHKLFNSNLFEAVENINNGIDVELAEHYTIQMDQQLLVSGADKAIFVCSDGTPENMAWCWYETTEEKKQALIDGWAQFEKDLAAFEVKEEKAPVEAEYIPSLPALRVQINGTVTESNLEEYKQTALTFIESINTNLVSDQDFANAEEAVKFLKKAEKDLKQARENILSQSVDINAVIGTLDEMFGAANKKRLFTEKLVKQRKEVMKVSILNQAKESIQAHWAELVSGINPTIVPVNCPIQADIAGAMKGKKTVKSLEDAANTEAARTKIEATKLAEKLKFNLDLFDAEAAKHKFLFNDIRELVYKESGDFKATIVMRMAEYEAEEARRQVVERERIQMQERAKLQREQDEREQAAQAAQAQPEEQKRLIPENEAAKTSTNFDTATKAKTETPNTLTQDLDNWCYKIGLAKYHHEELLHILTKHGYQVAA